MEIGSLVFTLAEPKEGWVFSLVEPKKGWVLSLAEPNRDKSFPWLSLGEVVFWMLFGPINFGFINSSLSLCDIYTQRLVKVS
jgi:hypothetical protein